MGNKRFVIWSAVSTLPQAKKISLEDQIEEAKRHISRHGGDVVATLRVPGQSRSIVLFEDACQRIEAYAELHDMIRRKAFDVLIYLDRSRLGRKASLSMAVVELCHEAGISTYEMESPPASLGLTESHDDMLIGAIKSVGAQQEIRKLQERHRKGMLGRAKSGKFPNRIPYGYRRVYNLDGSERIEIDTDEAAQMRTALLDLYVGRSMSQREVAEEMTRRGYTYRTGKPWAVDHVVTILRAVWQASGKVVLNRVSRVNRPQSIHDGAHPAILTDDEAQVIFNEKRNRRGYFKAKARLPRRFSGVLRCGVCGGPLHVKDDNSSYGVAYSCRYNRCDGSRIHETRIVAYMEDTIRLLADIANRDAILAATAIDSTVTTLQDIDNINRRLKALDARQARLLRAYVDLGAIDEDDFVEQRQRLDAERVQLLAQLDTLSATREEIEDAAKLGDRLVDIAQIGIDALHDAERNANLWLRRHFVITIVDSEVEAIEYL